MNYLDTYNLWKNDHFFNPSTREELAALDPEVDQKEIEDRFYCDLSFGTGGLRGVMGAGTNRMNRYTVGKATMGLGKYLLHLHGAEKCRESGVAVGYDTRNNSEYFSRITANVLSGMGIRVRLHARACPTPQLSFSVRHWRTLAGVVITASHNPREYNGYKVYDEFGCQLVPKQAEKVIAYVNAVTDYRAVNFAGDSSLISVADCTDDFASAVMQQSRYHDAAAKSNLKIVYTPLHGTGSIPVQEVLRLDGFTQVDTVAEQMVPDGNFPTVASPNPEDRRALELGIAQAGDTDADIVLGTDPDADRVGIAVRVSDGGYQLMTGNQVGALLMDFLLNHTDFSGFYRPAVVKTVVTSELGAEMARRKGLAVFSTLTGFKYIGEKIVQFGQAGMKGIPEQRYDFVFGYEESYGYLAGTHAADKDAVVSSLLICEMAARAKAEGMTLAEKMDRIYAEFGYYQDALDSFTLKGKDGLESISSMMHKLRSGGSPFKHTVQVTDYSVPVAAEPGFGSLPNADVLKYVLEDGSWIAVRPSGTEPKIKIYYSVKGENRAAAETKLREIRDMIQAKLGLK
ncbi:MAG TPA: phospho-sugar mutase [Lachnospiraceae bacterium]|nr:phospho-sugar mutase [Lachnospiraceae bacterium]